MEFTITGVEEIREIWYQFDIHYPNASEVGYFKLDGDGVYNDIFHVSGTATEKKIKVVLPFTEGLHEISLAARDVKYNFGYFHTSTYYITSGLEGGYVNDDVQPVLQLGQGYPTSGGTVSQDKILNIDIKEEDSGVYYFAYKFTESEPSTEAPTIPFGDENTKYKYGPGNHVEIPVPKKPGFYYFQFFASDGAGNLSDGRWTRLYVVDKAAPTIKLKGDASIVVPVNTDPTTFVDPGAIWEDNTDAHMALCGDPDLRKQLYTSNV